MWYETAIAEIGMQGNLELEISLVTHTEDPDRAVFEMREALGKMMKKRHGERR